MCCLPVGSHVHCEVCVDILNVLKKYAAHFTGLPRVLIEGLFRLAASKTEAFIVCDLRRL